MAQGAHVVIAARDQKACAAAAEQLRQEGHPGECVCAQLDLEDYNSVRQFAEEQKKALRARGKGKAAKLDVLVNNAGM